LSAKNDCEHDEHPGAHHQPGGNDGEHAGDHAWDFPRYASRKRDCMARTALPEAVSTT
jgi:hypothetical protein